MLSGVPLLQMAGRRSVELNAFNFARRTFIYRSLAQGQSRALSAFSSFMREYLDSVIKADQCAQYVDVIGIAANTTEQLIKNIRAVFKCIRTAGLKLTIEKCHFGVTQVEFLARTITPDGVAPQDQKVKNFLSKVRSSSKIHWLGKPLPKIHTAPVKKTHRYVRTPKSRLQNWHSDNP